MNSRCLTIQPMFHVSCTALSSLSNGLKRSWPGQTRHFSPNGSVTAIPTLKKSPKRKGGHPLRRRSQLPPGPHAPPDMGAPGLAATNPHHRTRNTLKIFGTIELYGARFLYHFQTVFNAETYIEYLERTLCSYCPRKIYLIQDNASYHKDRTVWTWFSGSSQTYGSLQPSRLFSTAQCGGAHLAPCPSTWHPRSLFRNPRRAALGIDFHVSQYPAKFPTGTRLFAALSIEHMSRYLCNDI